MLTFLFWNLQKKPLQDSLYRLVEKHQVDILLLAENTLSVGEILSALNPNEEGSFHYSPSGYGEGEKIHVYTRFPSIFSQPLTGLPSYRRHTTRIINLPGKERFLLIAAHLESKVNMDNASHRTVVENFADDLREAEKIFESRASVVIGDINANPFEDGVISARGLHAVSSRRVAEKIEREVSDKSYPFLYNPMWGLYSEQDGTPPGTHYYGRSGYVCHFWNMFDQVLLRPEMLPFWIPESLQILTDDGEESFLTEGNQTPTREKFSDHLPIICSLDI
jgi:Endonuclease/Exonuclease/phosphatase family